MTACNQPSFAQPYPVRRVPLIAENVVATSQPLAAQAGVRMLLKGGNALDAALAAAITLTLVEPTGCGVGSDAFAIVWDGSELHGLNASGRSPAAWTPERFAGLAAMPDRGWESVTVPGAVSAWVALSERFGRLSFADLFEPAIAYARGGFGLSPKIAGQWASGAADLADQPGFRDHFMPGGRAPQAGERVFNPDLAATLELIASTRGEAFYRGELGEKLVRSAAEHGAALTMADLDAHRAEWCGTISSSLKGAELHEIPPNGQGIAALIAAGILDHTEIAELALDSPEFFHLQIEAVKLALADVERHVGDPDHMRVPLASLLDPAYLGERAALIDRKQAGLPGAGAPKYGGTVYVTAADAGGMMVSFIQSNYKGFGSGVVVPGTGIHLQDRALGFCLEPGHPNQVGGGKRPFHTIIPGFVMRDGKPCMSFGVMGGQMQAQGHVQMLVRSQLFGQNPQAAIDAPRWRFLQGRTVALENAMPEVAVSALATLGHDIVRDPPDTSFGYGGAQIIQRVGDLYVAGSDPRRDGIPVGY
jgi:gamma-glutamyltranspeptidase / glutathione hydrolase